MIGRAPVTRPRRQQGLSLLEILVALITSLILLLGAIQIFMGSRATNAMNEGLARVHDTGRAALQLMSRDLRMAGYTGCPEGFLADNLSSIALDGNGQNVLRSNQFILGIRNADLWAFQAQSPDAGVPGLPTGITLTANSDIVVIQRLDDFETLIASTNSPANSIRIVNNNGGFSPGDTIAVSNCETADLFNITAVVLNPDEPFVTITHETTGDAGPGNSANVLQHSYEDTAQVGEQVSHVGRFLRNTYFLGTRNGANQQTPSLFRMDIMGNTVELVEGVQRMRIQYGLDTNDDGNVNLYRNANNVSADDWRQVQAMDIALLVTSNQTLFDNQASSFTLFNDAEEFFNDRRMRQVFSTTITIRNRAP